MVCLNIKYSVHPLKHLHPLHQQKYKETKNIFYSAYFSDSNIIFGLKKYHSSLGEKKPQRLIYVSFYVFHFVHSFKMSSPFCKQKFKWRRGGVRFGELFIILVKYGENTILSSIFNLCNLAKMILPWYIINKV